MKALKSASPLLSFLVALTVPTVASAERDDLELGLELAGGLPVTGYLTPPGKNDLHARAGGLALLNLGVGISPAWSIEILGGAGYLAELAEGNDEAGGWIGQIGVGPKLRLGEERRLWLSAHGGLFEFDGAQFGLDGAMGYDFGAEDGWRFGPLARYQVSFAGTEDPRFPEDTRTDAALWLGFGIRFVDQNDKARDPDADGLTGDADKCPQDAEDKDDFEDEDGCPDLDNDTDGILDKKDECPLEAEDADGFQDEDGCPELDNDGDGIDDSEDKCPLELEDEDEFEDEDGCPELDNDADGIPDAEDKCLNDKEDVDGFQDEDGCPELDNDGDGVPDTEDECPKAPGHVDTKGCPKAIRLDEETQRIEILETIEFEYASAKLKEGAEVILGEVKGVLVANPGIAKVRIEGHSDDRGPDEVNLRLSTQRAASVSAWLTENGIDKGRLQAFGCGEKYPLGANTTADQRAKNRRVEFFILDGKEENARADCQAAEPETKENGD